MDAKQIILSAKDLSKWTSIFPVPLNSSYITSSIREPVSTSAVIFLTSSILSGLSFASILAAG